ncbi:MAG TPA: CDP-glycerol glycerophosphotransferase family protein, partial [Ramlibacter sp.]
MTIAFFVWNPFQVYQFESVVKHLPGAVYLLEKRKNMEFDRLFTPEFMATLNAPVHFVTRAGLKTLDGTYDAIVCQTAFAHMERYEKTKLVGLQYSMSKERHQYGAWRTMCDLNLVYGQYSLDRIAPLSPSLAVGNPRFDRWFEGALDPLKLQAVRERLDPAKKTVLYLPTWGDLSSMTHYGEAVAALGDEFNVIAKVHHKTDTHEAARKIALTNDGIAQVFGASDDLLHLLHEADVVLSDFSGAIFDAINVGKPVILLQRDPEGLAAMGAEKFGLESIEYAHRDAIGPVVEDASGLADAVRGVLSGVHDFAERNAALKKACFSHEAGCGELAARAIEALVRDGSPERPYDQIYVRDTLRALRAQVEDLKLAAKKPLGKVAAAFTKKKPAPAAKPAAAVRSATPVRAVAKKLPPAREMSFKRILRFVTFPARVVIERYVQRVVEGSREQAFKPSPMATRLAGLLTSRRLLSLSRRYDAQPTRQAGIWLAQLASRKNSKAGLTTYIKVLGKYDRRDDMARLFDEMSVLALKDKARYLQRAARIQDFIGVRDEQLRVMREEVFVHVSQRLATSGSKIRNADAMRVMVVNRWLDEAARFEATAVLPAPARKRTREAVARSRRLLEEFWGLVAAANHNHRPALAAGDYLCLAGGQIQPVSQVAPGAVVEFFLPPYFFSENETEAATRDRICRALVAMLRSLVEQGVAIVPRHQFRLDSAYPSGHWPHALSYHTTGAGPGRWHIKDAPLSGYFSIDPEGFSGWASIARLATLPESARLAPAESVEETWRMLQERFVAAKVSKYVQQQAEFAAPAGPYVFVPLQTVGDVVARLARIPTLEL